MESLEVENCDVHMEDVEEEQDISWEEEELSDSEDDGDDSDNKKAQIW